MTPRQSILARKIGSRARAKHQASLLAMEFNDEIEQILRSFRLGNLNPLTLPCLDTSIPFQVHASIDSAFE